MYVPLLPSSWCGEGDDGVVFNHSKDGQGSETFWQPEPLKLKSMLGAFS